MSNTAIRFCNLMAANSIFFLLMLSILCPCSTRDVYIQPSEGAEHCPGTCYNINTFGKMAHKNFSNSTDLIVHFLEGTHLLDLQELVVFTNMTMLCLKVMGEWSMAFMRLSGSLQWSSSVLSTPVLVLCLLIASTSPLGT